MISFIAWIVASRTGRPFSSQRSMFSSTTIASSTTMPIASTRPNSVRLLSEKPSMPITANVPMSDTPTSITGSSSAFQSCRNSEHDDRDQDHGVAQRFEHFAHRFVDERRRVVRDAVLEAAREALFQLLHFGLNQVGRIQCVRARKLKDRQADGRLCIEREPLVLILRAEFHSRDVFEIGDFAVLAGRQDDVRQTAPAR